MNPYKIYYRMIEDNGPDCTYGPSIVARATGMNQLWLQRRYGEYIPAETFRRLLRRAEMKSAELDRD